jgi:hypothetical protein
MHASAHCAHAQPPSASTATRTTERGVATPETVRADAPPRAQSRRERRAVCYRCAAFSCSATLRAPSAVGRGPVPVLVEATVGHACVPVEWHGLETVCVS